MQIWFRRAAPADAPAMARLLVLAWQRAYRGILSDALLDTRDPEENAKRIRTGIETRPDFRYHVLEADGVIAGVSVFNPCEDDDLADTTEIMVFYIHPERQRQGLGRMMMARTLAAIRESGGEKIALWVLKDNRNARAFYEAMGFAADGAEKLMKHLENVPAVRYRYEEKL